MVLTDEHKFILEAVSMVKWYKKPSLFFKDITGLTPSSDQEAFLDSFKDLDNKKKILSASRTTGKTLCLAVLSLWFCVVVSFFLTKSMHVLIMSGGLEQAKRVYEHVRDYSKHQSIKVHLKELPRDTLSSFINGSRIEIIPTCVTGDTPIITLNGLERASDVKVGEYLYTLSGEFKRLISKEEQYSSEIVEIMIQGRSEPIRVSLEHPFLVFRARRCSWIKNKEVACKPCSFSKCRREYWKSYRSEWILARDLRKTDLILFPVPRSKNIIPNDLLIAHPKSTKRKISIPWTKNICRLIGYFISDGSVGGPRIPITLGKKDSWLDDLIYVESDLQRKTHVLDLSNKIIASFSCKSLAKKLKEEFYRDKVKYIPSYLYDLSKELKMEILIGALRGDGTNTVGKGGLIFSNKSTSIISFLYLASVENDLIPSFRKIDRRTGCYSLVYSGRQLIKLLKLCKFNETYIRRSSRRTQRSWFKDNFLISSIRKISKGKGETVFNLVTEDHTYTTLGAVLHNSDKQYTGPHPNVFFMDEAGKIKERMIIEAIPMIDSKANPPGILALTSTPYDFLSKFVEMWTDGTNLGYEVYGPWKQFDCLWLNKKEIEESKKVMDSRSWSIHYEGTPQPLTGTLFNTEDVKKCRTKDRIDIGEGPIEMTVDWGQNPASTAILVGQWNGEHLMIVEAHLLKDKPFPDIHALINMLVEKYTNMNIPVEKIFCDASYEGENYRLEKANLPIRRVVFKAKKPLMIAKLAAMIEHQTVHWWEEYDELTRQIAYYTHDSKRNDDYTDCYDRETELLTKDGWKKIDTITKEMKVLSLKDGIAIYENPIMLIKEYSSKMIQVQAKGVDLLVSPNHKLYVASSKGANNYDSYKLVKINDLIGKHFRLNRKVEWIGDDYKGHELIPSTWLRFLGIYLSKGSLGYDQVIISQTSSNNKLIEEILASTPFKWIKDDRSHVFRTSDMRLHKALTPLGTADSKYIPREYLLLKKECLKSLFDGMMLGDRSRNNYYTISRRLADDFQELAVKLGYSATLILKKNREGKIRNRLIKGREWIFNVCLGTKQLYPRINHHKKTQLTEIDWNDYVYCITVPSHVILVRRNGRVCWSGNSMMMFMESTSKKYKDSGGNSWLEYVRDKKNIDINTKSTGKKKDSLIKTNPKPGVMDSHDLSKAIWEKYRRKIVTGDESDMLDSLLR